MYFLGGSVLGHPPGVAAKLRETLQPVPGSAALPGRRGCGGIGGWGKPAENGDSMGKPWGKPWENDDLMGKTIGKW